MSLLSGLLPSAGTPEPQWAHGFIPSAPSELAPAATETSSISAPSVSTPTSTAGAVGQSIPGAATVQSDLGDLGSMFAGFVDQPSQLFQPSASAPSTVESLTKIVDDLRGKLGL
jgi:hypothetical protein